MRMLVTIVGYSIYSDVSHAVHDAELSTRTLTKIVAANTNRTLNTSREAMENLGQRPLTRSVAILS
jgi:hypothetical protein